MKNMTVVELAPVVNPRGTPDEQGCRLIYRETPESEPTFKGIVLTANSVPRWMSKEYPAALKDHLDGEVNLDDYAPEWFEKIVYVRAEDIAANAGSASWIGQVNRLNKVFDHRVCTGCARCTPASPVYFVQFGAEGEPTGAEYEGTYYTLITQQRADNAAVAKEITIAPKAARTEFQATEAHRRQKEDCEQLMAQADPTGRSKKEQRELLEAALAPALSLLKLKL